MPAATTSTGVQGPPRAAAQPPPPVLPPAVRRPRVAVIGAGFAGLAAALTLQRSRCCDVVVLEAGSRPGGRACTQQVSREVALELGATWFHGLGSREEPNPVFRHAVEQGLIGSAPRGEKWWSSQFLLPGCSQPLSKEAQMAVTHSLAAWSGVVDELAQDAGGTTADHLAAAWRELQASGRVPAGQDDVAQRAWRWREHLQRAMDGCDSTSDQSAQGLALYDEMPGGVHAVLPAGMQTVAEGLASQLGDLRYRHAVSSIQWSGPGGVRIACTNGATVLADAAIVTVSLGVLKAQHQQLFDPPLPEAKLAAVQRLRIGAVDKIFLDFTPEAGSSSSSNSGGDGLEAGAEAERGTAAQRGPVVSYALLWGGGWEGSRQEAVQGGLAVQAVASEAEEQLPEWARGIFSIRFGGPEVKRAGQAGDAAVQPEQQAEEGEDGEAEAEFSPCAEAARPTSYQAVAWLTGSAARGMEAASDEEVLAALRQLAQVFPQLQLPPGASWDRVTLHRSRWASDPLFRGSYSYLGADCSPADVAALAAPVYAPVQASKDAMDAGTAGRCAGLPVLLFAGEACHVKYIGTMHAAYMTGQQQAELLLRHFQQQQNQQRLLSGQHA